MHVLRWAWEHGAREHDCERTEAITCEAAAAGGHMEVLRWLREHGHRWDEGTCHAAAKGGHLEVLKWVRGHGCPWTPGTCAGAAQGGHMDVLEWLRVHGCPFDESACEFAARGGQLAVLQWLRGYGCPWDASTCESAIGGSKLKPLLNQSARFQRLKQKYNKRLSNVVFKVKLRPYTSGTGGRRCSSGRSTTVGWCRLAVSKPVLKARIVSALESTIP